MMLREGPNVGGDGLEEIVVPVRLELLVLSIVVVKVLVLPRLLPLLASLNHFVQHRVHRHQHLHHHLGRPQAAVAPERHRLVERFHHGELDVGLGLLLDHGHELLEHHVAQPLDKRLVAEPVPHARDRAVDQLRHEGGRGRPDFFRVDEGEEGDHESSHLLEEGEHPFLQLREVADEHVACSRLLLQRRCLERDLLRSLLRLHHDGRDALLLLLLLLSIVQNLIVGFDARGVEQRGHDNTEVRDEIVLESLG
mmetsp:Transcript_21673/g.71697  ORF Transcript_21673/g.71697 Transcript_21673/m.71697 type:complete len:252 (+) Transcript_21673:889-1644(+)